MGHADFRVANKIFASLGPDESWSMVKLTPSQQHDLIASRRLNAAPAAGAWGIRGATIIQLADADQSLVAQAVVDAWRNTAPKRLLRDLD